MPGNQWEVAGDECRIVVNKTAGLNDRSLLRIFDIWKESFRILRSERTSPRLTSTNAANFPFSANDRFEASIYRPSLTGPVKGCPISAHQL
jgi:hypothetical protein